MSAVSPSPSQTSATHEGLSFRAFVALAACLMAVNALAIDIMLPGLPAIGNALGVIEDNTRQLVLGAYLVGFGAAQLIWGPLADRFGRRPTLMTGLGLFAVASVFAALAPTFDNLLIARFVQGIAAASTRVMAVAIVRDCYAGRDLGRVMSLVMTVFMVVPILAPSIGQAMLFIATWRSIFLLLVLLGVSLLLWCASALPETLPPGARRPLALKPLLGTYREIAQSRITLGYTLALGAIFGCLFGFLTSAQQIMQEVYGLGLWFTVAFAAMALLMSGASFLNATLVRRFGMRPLAHGALIAFTVLGSIQLGWAMLLGDPPFWAFFALTASNLLLFGFIGANLNALALEPMGHIAGTAAAFTGFAQTVMGALIGSMVGQFFAGRVVPLAAAFAGLGALALAIAAVTERGRLMRPQPR